MKDVEYGKLKGRIIEKFGSYGNFAEFLQISPSTVSNKTNAKIQFDQGDIIKWCSALEIPIDKAYLYFFPKSIDRYTDGGDLNE